MPRPIERPWGDRRQVPIPQAEKDTFNGYPLIRGMFFITNDILLVGFFPDTLAFK